MEEIICPQCGRAMVLRMARRGLHQGSAFYGCTGYPECKAIRQPEEEAANHGALSQGIARSDPLVAFPRTLRARPCSRNHHARFFESVAVTKPLLEALKDRLDDVDIRLLSQWRLDYPSNDEPPTTDDRTRTVLAIAEKLLTRGRVTLCSPEVEKSLTNLFKPGPISSHESPRDAILGSAYGVRGFQWFDAPSESGAYAKLLLYLGDSTGRWVLPQVEIMSLAPQAAQGIHGRVDFLVCHPKLDQPVVVEVDGEQHERQGDADAARDTLLVQNGYRVLRIPAAELAHGTGPQMDELREVCEECRINSEAGRERPFGAMQAAKTIHQIQLSLLQAIGSGLLDTGSLHVSTDLDEAAPLGTESALALLRLAVEDLLELLSRICQLHALPKPACKITCSVGAPTTSKPNAVHISYLGADAVVPTLRISEVFLPFHMASDSLPCTSAYIPNPGEQALTYFLRYLFRYPTFWEGQLDALTRVLQGRDTIVLLPTAGGKSIIYWLASLLLPGRAVVIEPTIALMEDQRANLAGYGIDRCLVISSSELTDPDQRARAMTLYGHGEYLFAYVAPERLQITAFRNTLRTLTMHIAICLVVVDEAHCISEWGHDFRTAYLNIGRTARQFCASNGTAPPIVALTGTASRAVLKDVQRELHILDFDAIVTPKSFDRPELRYHMIACRSEEKMARLKAELERMHLHFSATSASFFEAKGDRTNCGLVFCPHVDGEFGVVEVCSKIQELGIDTAYYSGKTPSSWTPDTWLGTKQSVAHRFKRDELPLLICTKAFGMGIDKPNIRYVVHYCLPSSIESFYQEAGRAGRDGKPAHCFILVSNDDPSRTTTLLDLARTKVETISQEIKTGPRDDITRALWFHVNSFRGVKAELEQVAQAVDKLGDLRRRRSATLTYPAKDRQVAEKALHRLLILGVLSDYTINYSRNEFAVEVSGASGEQICFAYGQYVAGYLETMRENEIDKLRVHLNLPHRDFVVRSAEELLRFVYEVIEEGRRRNLGELLKATAGTDAEVRQRILRYLEATVYSDGLDELLKDRSIGLEGTRGLLASVRSPNEAAVLRGQVSRYLGSYPTLPSLLMLRALSELMSRDGEPETAYQDFMSAIQFAVERYSFSRESVYDFDSWGLQQVAGRDPELAEKLTAALLGRYPDVALARVLIRALPPPTCATPAWFLLGGLSRRAGDLLTAMRGDG
jgi:ATP-dependent DNA helicase RecQ